MSKELDELAEAFANKKYNAQSDIESQVAWSDCKEAVVFGYAAHQSKMLELSKEMEKSIREASIEADALGIYWYQQGAHFGVSLARSEAEAEIERLKEERDSAIKAMDHHINCDMRTQEEFTQLRTCLEVCEVALKKNCKW